MEWQPEHVTVDLYLRGRETLRRRELIRGVLREPPAPRWGHQAVVTRLTVLLDTPVRAQALGRVCVSPLDVILDQQNSLILQPDVIFVSNARQSIVRDQVWGAPDLVIEVFSSATERRDRTMKVMWYRRYGARECWLVCPRRRRIAVLAFHDGKTERRGFHGRAAIESGVLPGLTISAADVFDV